MLHDLAYVMRIGLALSVVGLVGWLCPECLFLIYTPGRSGFHQITTENLIWTLLPLSDDTTEITSTSQPIFDP
jgi:hypothetical protein